MRPTSTIAFIMLCLSTLPGIGSGVGLLRAQVPETDTVAVVEAARAVLEGITTRDTELIRSVTAADLRLEGTSTGDDRPGRAEGQSRDAFLAVISEAAARFVERMWAPVVRIRGRTADVQAPYDFYRGGELSHCGVDLFQLVLTAEGWKVVSLIWTVEQPPACELHPEGPPAEELGQKGRMMPDGLEHLERWAAEMEEAVPKRATVKRCEELPEGVEDQDRAGWHVLRRRWTRKRDETKGPQPDRCRLR